MLDDKAFEQYAGALTPEQSENVGRLRRLLQECSPGLSEEICDGKWYNGLLIYKQPGTDFILYAAGPLSKGFTTFHMMPYYASAKLQSENGAALKPFLTGKSCIKFKHYADLPEDALRSILSGGAEALASAKAALAARK